MQRGSVQHRARAPRQPAEADAAEMVDRVWSSGLPRCMKANGMAASTTRRSGTGGSRHHQEAAVQELGGTELERAGGRHAPDTSWSRW